MLDGATGRAPFAGEGGRTGASFESAVLADGTPVVIKHITPNDWLIVATGGTSRLYDVWESGTFARVPKTIDHAMLAMEEHGDGWIVVMRDVSDGVLEEGRVLSRSENRRILEAADALHLEFWGEDVPGGLPLLDHYSVMTPKGVAAADHLNTPIPGLVRRGWELFSDVAPAEVADQIHLLLDEPGLIAKAFGGSPSTLIHGDVRLHNLGLSDEHVIMLDWEIVGTAPPSVDLAWYLIISASRIDASREQIIDDYREIAGERFDARAWDLACIGALMWLGWNKAIDILDNPDPAIREQERADLDWWVGRVREAFEVWSPR